MFVAHIEINMHKGITPSDMHQMLALHLEEALGQEPTTSFVQSYDEHKNLFRFDLPSSGILSYVANIICLYDITVLL